MRIRHTIPLAALGAALLLPAAAGAVNVRQAHFAAVVSAEATTTWSMNTQDPADMLCGARYTGHGTERFEFATRNAIRVTAMSVNGSDPIFAFGPTSRAPGIPVAGIVRRHGTSKADPFEPGRPCGAGNGTIDPELEPLDGCGTKHFAMTVRMNWTRGRVSLFPGSTKTQYKGCPAAGVVFPSFVTSKSPTRVLSSAFPKRDVFDATERKIELLGEGSQRSSADGTKYLSTIHWTIALTRVD